MPITIDSLIQKYDMKSRELQADLKVVCRISDKIEIQRQLTLCEQFLLELLELQTQL